MEVMLTTQAGEIIEDSPTKGESITYLYRYVPWAHNHMSGDS